jgi:hypothetical protein
MKFRNNIVLGMLSLLFVTASISCKKDDSSSSSYPKTVTIEYKVTNITGVNAVDVNYTNETGAVATFNAIALPWSKKITRTVNVNDATLLQITTDNTASNKKVKTEIYINDQLVKSQTPEGNFIYDQLIYIFQ